MIHKNMTHLKNKKAIKKINLASLQNNRVWVNNFMKILTECQENIKIIYNKNKVISNNKIKINKNGFNRKMEI
jgi:hypothetical protein